MTDLGTIGANSAKIGSEPGRAPDDAGAQAGRARDVARRPDRSGAAGCRQRHGARRARARSAPPPITRSRRSSCASRGMQGLLDTFKATKDDDSKNATTAGREARRAGAQARRERRRLAGALPRPGAGDAAGRGRRRRHGPAVRLRRERRALHGPLDDGDLAPDPRRLDRWHAVRRPRHRAREGRRPARRHAARARHRDDDQGLDRSRLRRVREEHAATTRRSASR